MIGAILAQLFLVADSAVPPVVLLVGVAVVIWARWDEPPMRRPTVR
jgi:hypothetical protein